MTRKKAHQRRYLAPELCTSSVFWPDDRGETPCTAEFARQWLLVQRLAASPEWRAELGTAAEQLGRMIASGEHCGRDVIYRQERKT